MEENGHLYRIYRLQAFMDFYIELGGCQKISLERFDFYIGMQIGICQYIVEKRIIYFLFVRYILSRHEPILSSSFYIARVNPSQALHTRHIHYPSGLCY